MAGSVAMGFKGHPPNLQLLQHRPHDSVRQALFSADPQQFLLLRTQHHARQIHTLMASSFSKFKFGLFQVLQSQADCALEWFDHGAGQGRALQR